jgi:DNA-binding MarR family transcriptional regulator
MSKHTPFATTIQIRDTCLCLHVQRAARALARQFDEALRPVGLNSGQFSLLNALNRPEPPMIGQVAQLLAMDRTTLTAALKPLERDGLVTVARDVNDRRSRLLRLTEKGHEVLASAVPIWRDVHAEIEADLPQSDPEELRVALNALSRPASRP